MSEPMHRREFVKSAGFAAVGFGLLGMGGSVRAGRFTGRIKKAVKYHMITEDLSVMDKFKMLADLGYDGVEPRTRDIGEGKADRKELLRASEATGVRIHGVVNSSDPDINSAIDLSKYFGGTSVLTVVPTDAKGSYLENYDRTQEIIRRAIPHAEEQNIQILIENVWATFLIEPLTMTRYIDELDSPAVGAYFDVGNNARWGQPHHWVEVLGDRIGKLDIKDYDLPLSMSEGMRKGFVKIGEGSFDWGRVREELAKIDYEGWATAEVRGGGRERLAEISERMDRVLDL